MTMGYPIILGGDHAAFEQEWAASGKPDSERPDWPLPSFDARDWAEVFCKIAKEHGHDLDEGWMTTWFANALMRGFDERTSREPSELADAQADALRLHREATDRLDALLQIRIVCDDNAGPACDKGMALAFVRDVAANALREKLADAPQNVGEGMV